MNISIVILHYVAMDETEKCVESILNQEKYCNQNINIIIVDNASPNKTGEQLKNKYKNIHNIHIICSKTNMGFAKGNNLGYEYALKNNNPDIVILSNNDIQIIQKNFFDLLASAYKKTNFGVCGPDIYLPKKKIHQNPLTMIEFDKRGIKRLILEYRVKLLIFKILKITHLYIILKKIKTNVNIQSNTNWKNMSEGIGLHGAFLILGKSYINAFPKGLYDKTFMYLEEAILYYQCKKKKIRMIYDPNISVVHNEGIATLQINGENVDKSIFEFRTTIESAKIFLNLMENKD